MSKRKKYSPEFKGEAIELVRRSGAVGFDQGAAGHGTEAVTTNLHLGVIAHAPQGFIDGVFRHRLPVVLIAGGRPARSATSACELVSIRQRLAPTNDPCQIQRRIRLDNAGVFGIVHNALPMQL